MENFDDFENDYDDYGEFMDDTYDFDEEDSFDDGPEMEDEDTDDMCDDEFTTKDAVILGSAMGWAYEEGLEEARRRKLEKKMNKDKDNNQDDL